MKPALWNVIKGVSGNANYKNLSDNLIKTNNIPDKNLASLELLKNYSNNQLLFDTKENILISNYLPDISSASINKPNLRRAYKQLEDLYHLWLLLLQQGSQKYHLNPDFLFQTYHHIS